MTNAMDFPADQYPHAQCEIEKLIPASATIEIEGR
jgi:hypothetical protein